MSALQKLLSINAIIAVTLVFGLINNIAITALFGLNRQVDAYFASMMLLNLFIYLVVDYLGKNFLPVYAIRRKVSAESASDLVSLVVTQVGLLSVVVALMLVTFSEQLFSILLPGFEDEGVSMVVNAFVIMTPCIVLKTINAFHEYVWQYNEHYNRVIISRLFLPITLTFFILGLGDVIGAKALPYGFLVGNLLSAACLAYRVPYSYRFRLGFTDPDFLKIIRNSGLLMSTGVIARTRSVIVQYFGSQLGEGAISAFAIASKICQPVFESALVGIRMILFSRSAKAVARADVPAFARMHNLAFVGVLFFTIPIAFWYALDGELIIRAVFQRGEFTDEMVFIVYAALIGLSGHAIFAGVVQMASNAFYALDRVGVPATVMPLGTCLYLLLAVLLVPAYGLLGLAASGSIVSLVTAVVLLLILKLQINLLALDDILVALGKYSLVALGAVMASRWVVALLDVNVIFRLLVSAITVGVIYIAVIWLSRDKFLHTIMDKSGINFPRRGQIPPN